MYPGLVGRLGPVRGKDWTPVRKIQDEVELGAVVEVEAVEGVAAGEEVVAVEEVAAAQELAVTKLNFCTLIFVFALFMLQ